MHTISQYIYRYIVFFTGIVSGIPSTLAPVPVARYYHENFGIKAAARIKDAEDNHFSFRISGGNSAELGSHPFLGGVIITLVSGDLSQCGSTLLSHTRAVTAAHCWWDGQNQAQEFELVFGSTQLFFGGTRVKTKNVETHKGWNVTTLQNDIAIVRMSFVHYTAFISNAFLPTGWLSDMDFEGLSVIAAGFGKQSDSTTSSPSTQQQVTLHVISNTVCRQKYGNTITSSILCTDGIGGHSTCSGDSGGPLYIVSEGKFVLIGITSFGAKHGCEKGYPAAFTRVTSYLRWIEERL